MENKNTTESLISEIDNIFSDVLMTCQTYRREVIERLVNYADNLNHSKYACIESICSTIEEAGIIKNIKIFHSTRYSLIIVSLASIILKNGSKELLNSDSSILNEYLKTL